MQANGSGFGVFSHVHFSLPPFIHALNPFSVQARAHLADGAWGGESRDVRKVSMGGAGGSDDGEQGGVEGALHDATPASSSATLLPQPPLPSLQLMLLNNTTCCHLMEGKGNAVPAAAGAVFKINNNHCNSNHAAIRCPSTARCYWQCRSCPHHD